MNTEDVFLKKWFAGVNNFLQNVSKEDVESFLSNCAKGCSDSFSLQMYQNAFHEKDDIKRSLDYLSENFNDFWYTLFPDRIHIVYRECGCDLFKEKLITSEKLCTCSEKSLLYNWESIFGKSNVTVTRKKSKLNGDAICLFEINVKQLGHST